MTTDVVQAIHDELSFEQIDAMKQRHVKKHHVAIILLHWFNATTWLVELATGAALISSRQFAFVPRWYLEMMADLAGSRANLLRMHIAVGLTWIAVFLVYAVFGVRTYLTAEVVRREIALDRDDVRWLAVRVRGILGRSRGALPPQGVYNAGQKLFAIMVYAMIPWVMATGVVMTFHLGGTTLVGWAAALHFVAVGIVVSGLMIHVYMGAVFPEEKPAFFSMITGTVDEYFAYHHHYKWWRELQDRRAARAALRQRVIQTRTAKTPADTPTDGPYDGVS